ncbi:MAG: hypothetical protein UV09_C0002G0033 [Candidatus Gottesmanbacteria bacterium GW2011_GWA2_42_18]|uniref:Uncharacterized protein n=1 Tax=Candidatus Gottesmanbacteria bacterium GW2011_GWA2_42_18 TaxID=1618442 RepID=A0A0G0ZGG3_9BACT|nr:MAG: hypothetical protein UV09_C0002G0033 [Candidatus Gottesmanbacteria bacterium GW2011_GWA2_42_18]
MIKVFPMQSLFNLDFNPGAHGRLEGNTADFIYAD